MKDWYILIDNFELLLREAGFKKDRDEIKEILQYMKNKKFSILFMMIADIINDLANWSQLLQSRASITDAFHLNQIIINQLNLYLTDDYFQNNVKNFLKRCENSQNMRSIKSITTYLENDVQINTQINDFMLENTDILRSDINEIRKEFINNLIKTFSEWFPTNEYETLSILDLRDLPSTSSTAPYGGDDIQEQFFKLTDMFIDASDEMKINLYREFVRFIEESRLHTLYKKYIQCGKTIDFYQFFLKQKDLSVYLKRILLAALSTPLNSADAERGFSLMNYYKSKSRNRILSEKLEELMFLNMNGPESENFNAKMFALLWLKEGHMQADDKSQQRKQKNQTDDDPEPYDFLDDD